MMTGGSNRARRRITSFANVLNNTTLASGLSIPPLWTLTNAIFGVSREESDGVQRQSFLLVTIAMNVNMTFFLLLD